MRYSPSMVLLIVLGAAAVVRAGPRLDQALALQKQSQHEEALRLFEAEYAETKDAWVLAQIGVEELSLGRRELSASRLARAEAHLTEALAQGDNLRVARDRAVLLTVLGQTRVRQGSVFIECQVRGAEVYLGGALLSRLPMTPQPVDIGRRPAEIRAPGYQRVDLGILEITPGGRVSRQIVLFKAPLQLHKKWWFWTAVGAGALVVVGTGLLIWDGTREKPDPIYDLQYSLRW